MNIQNRYNDSLIIDFFLLNKIISSEIPIDEKIINARDENISNLIKVEPK